MAHTATAEWIIEFLGSNPEEWSETALEDHQQRWRRLMGPLWKGVKAPGRSRLIEWHMELTAIVEKLQKGEAWVQECISWRQLRIEGGKAVTNQRSYVAEKDGKGHLARVMDAFTEAGGTLGLCHREDCRNLFVRRRRQKYCSTTCRGTVGKRK